MSGADARRPWPGQPQQCTCTRMIVGDLAETLDCPAGWFYVRGTGWCHILGGAR